MRKFAWFSLGFALAAFSVLFFSPCLLTWQILGGIALISFALACVPPVVVRRVGCVLLGISVCLLLHQYLDGKQQSWNDAHGGEHQAIQATAVDYSATLEYGYLVEVAWDGCRGTVYYDDPVAIAPGDTVEAVAVVSPTETSGPAEDFTGKSSGLDFRAMAYDGITVTPAEELSWRYFPAWFAQQIRLTLPEIANLDTAAFLRALFLGESYDLTDDFYNDMAICGVSHIIAISGMHFSMLMTILVLAFGKGKRGAVVTLAVIWFYALAVGARPSVIRSAVMFTFLLLAPIVGRERDIATAFFGSLFFNLLANPFAIFSVSLQYSYATAAMIILFATKLQDGFLAMGYVKILAKKHWILEKILRLLSGPVCCTLAVTPATLILGVYYFGMFSLVAPVANMLIQPLVTWIFCLGLPITTLGIWLPALASVLMTPLEILVAVIEGLVTWFADLPLAAVFTANGYAMIFCIYLLVMSMVALVWRKRISLVLPAVCVVGALCLVYFLSSLEYDQQEMNLTAIDVGQGQSIYMESNGQSILYDCGGSVSNPGEEVARYLQSLGRTSIDTVVVSHYDMDHVGGVVYLLGRMSVGKLILPPLTGETSIEHDVVTAAQENGVPVTFATQDMIWDFGSGQANVFAPVSKTVSNDRSLALWVAFGDYDVLMTGDMGITAEKTLVYQKNIPDLEVVVAGHHGSDSSSGTGFLNLTTPEIVLISVGEDNTYGHPHQDVLERLAAIGATVYRTDLQGNITVRR